LHYANVAAMGLSCALDLEPAQKAVAVPLFEVAVRSALGEPPIEMAADDRSSLYLLLVAARDDASDAGGSKALAEQWLAFLDREAESAPSASARAVFDPHRLSAAIAAGEPSRAIPMLKRSEADFPKDYNPPARLAVAYREAGRLDEALAAADRALRLAYGPRKIRVFSTKADVLEKMGDPAGARSVLEQALRYAEKLPKAQVPPSAVEGLKRRIEKLEKGA
jgi:tetratricopeptide (TPR) repeat protein